MVVVDNSGLVTMETVASMESLGSGPYKTAELLGYVMSSVNWGYSD